MNAHWKLNRAERRNTSASGNPGAIVHGVVSDVPESEISAPLMMRNRGGQRTLPVAFEAQFRQEL